MEKVSDNEATAKDAAVIEVRSLIAELVKFAEKSAETDAVERVINKFTRQSVRVAELIDKIDELEGVELEKLAAFWSERAKDIGSHAQALGVRQCAADLRRLIKKAKLA